MKCEQWLKPVIEIKSIDQPLNGIPTLTYCQETAGCLVDTFTLSGTVKMRPNLPDLTRSSYFSNLS
jgi:hypothetical protein